MALTQSSRQIILDRQVTVVDLGLVGRCVIDKVDVGCSVVGQAPGRQPQELLSNLHYMLRLRVGGSAATSLSGDSVDDDGGGGGAGSHLLADGAAGSGACDEQSLLHNGVGDAVSVTPAGVLVKEEGCMSSDVGHAYPIFIE